MVKNDENLFRYCLVCAISANITTRNAVFLDLAYRIRSVQFNECHLNVPFKERFFTHLDDCPRWCLQFPKCQTVYAYSVSSSYRCAISNENFFPTAYGCMPFFDYYHWKKYSVRVLRTTKETPPTTKEKTTKEITTTERPTTERPTTERPTTERPTTEMTTTEMTTTEMVTTEPLTTEVSTTELITTKMTTNLVYGIRAVKLNGCYINRPDKKRYVRHFDDCPRWCLQIPKCLTVYQYFTLSSYRCVISYGNLKYSASGCLVGYHYDYWKKYSVKKLRTTKETPPTTNEKTTKEITTTERPTTERPTTEMTTTEMTTTEMVTTEPLTTEVSTTELITTKMTTTSIPWKFAEHHGKCLRAPHYKRYKTKHSSKCKKACKKERRYLVYRIRSVQVNGCYNVRLEKQRYLKDLNDCPRWCLQIPRCLTVLAYFDYNMYHCVISYGNFLPTYGCPPGVFYWKKYSEKVLRTTLPSAPRNLRVSSYTKNLIKATWSSPNGSLFVGVISNYSVCIRRVSLSTCISPIIVPKTQTSYTFTGLKPYVQYTIEISAATKVGYGPQANITQRTRESVPDGPPTKFQISRVDATNITASWLPPDPTLRNGRIINYKLCIKIGSTSQGPCLLQITTGNITVYTFLNLKPYTKYHLRISAVTKIGYGPAAVLTTRTLEAEPSSAPRKVNVVSYTKNLIKTTWSSPDRSLLNGILTKYSVCIRRQSLTSCTTKVTVPFKQTSYTFTGLKPYVQYTIEISAATKAGYGPGAKITQRTRESVPNGPPTKFQISQVDVTNITASWLPPDLALRNGRIINYKLCIKIGSTSQGPCLLQITTGNITTYIFVNLKPYTKYHLRISAATKIGYGPAAVLTTRTLEAEPSGAPRNLNVVSYTKNLIKTTWSSPDSSLHNGILTKYSVCIRQQSMTSCTPKVIVPFTKTSYTFTGLKPYVQYTIEISAATKVGYGPGANITQRTRESVPNGPPTKFQIYQVDVTNITASWLPPDPALRNGRIINYKLCIKIGSTSQGPCLLQITTGNITVYTFSNLKPYTKYNVGISAATKIGYGPAAVLTTRTLEAEPSGAPRNLNVVSYTKNLIKTTWSSPDSSLLNGILTKYSVCIRQQSMTSCTPKVIVPFTKTSYTFTGLKPYVQYTIEISAATKVGYGPRANITQRTRESVPDGLPMKFQISRVDATNITASWLPPDPTLRNGRIINYKLCIKIGSTSQGPCLLQITTGNITVYTFSNLKPYTKYHLRISAATKIGYGPAAFLTTRTLEAEPSGAPRNLNVVSYTKNFIKTTWSSPDSTLLNGILTKYSLCIRRQSLKSCTPKVIVPFTKTSYTFTGLKPYVQYTIEISAATKVGYGPGAKITQRTRESVPNGPPTKFQISQVDVTNITGSWLPPDPALRNGRIINYKLCIKIGSTSQGPCLLQITTGNITDYTFSNLKPYTKYHLRITSATKIGYGPAAVLTTRTLEAEPSGAPRNLNVVSYTKNFIKATWSSPDSSLLNGILTKYSVCIRRQSLKSCTPKVIVPFTKTSYTFTGLKPYVQYTIEISAGTKAGYGPRANITQRTKESVPKGPPTKFQISRVYATNITGSWLPPDPALRNGRIINYKLCIKIGSTSQGPCLLQITTGNIADYTFSNLKPYTKYHLRITSATKIGYGPAAVLTTRTLEAEPLGAPRNLNVVSYTKNFIKATWLSPDRSLLNGILTKYSVCIRGQSMTTCTPKVTVPFSQTSYTFTGLKPYVQYIIEISAATKAGYGPQARITQRTRESVPSGPPRLIIVKNVTARSLKLAWSPPEEHRRNGIITKYGVCYIETNSGQICSIVNYITDGKSSSKIIKGLKPYTEYLLAVMASTNLGWGPKAVISQKTLSSPPSGSPRALYAMRIGPHILQIFWQPPNVTMQNGHITGYRLCVHEKYLNAPCRIYITVPKTQLFHTEDNLKPYTLYNIHVEARNALGYGPANHIDFRTGEAAPSAPPKNAVLRTLSSRSIEINWTAPDVKDQNGILVLYEVIAYEEMFHSKVKRITNSSLSPNITVWKNNSLNPNINYIFHIKAGTIAGVGPPAVLHKHGNEENKIPDITGESVIMFSGIVGVSIFVVVLIVIVIICVSWKKRLLPYDRYTDVAVLKIHDADSAYDNVLSGERAQNLYDAAFVTTKYDMGNIAAENLYGTENKTTENVYDNSLAAFTAAIGASSQDIYRKPDNALEIDMYDSEVEIYELAQDAMSLKPSTLSISSANISLNEQSTIATVVPAIEASSQDNYKMSDNATAIDIYDSKMEIHGLAQDSMSLKPSTLNNSSANISITEPSTIATVVPAIKVSDNATEINIYDSKMEIHGLGQDSIKHSHTKNSHRKHRKTRKLKNSLTTKSLPKQTSLAVVVPGIGASSQDIYTMSDNATAVDIYDSNMEIYELAEDSIKHSHTKNSHRKHRKSRKLKNSLTTKSLPKPTSLAAVIPAIGACSEDIYRMSDNSTAVDIYDSNMEIYELAEDSIKHSHTKNSHRKHRKSRKLKNSLTTKSLPKPTSLAAVIPAIGACSEDIYRMSDNSTAVDMYDSNMEIYELAEDSIKHSHTKNSHQKHRKPRKLKNSLTTKSLPKPTSLAAVIPAIGASRQDVYRMSDDATAVDIYDSNMEIYELAEDSIKHSHTKNSHRKHRKPKKLKNSLTTKSLPKPTGLAAVVPAIGASSQDVYRMSDNATAVDIYDSNMEIYELAEDSIKHSHTKNSDRKHQKPRKLKNSLTNKSLPRPTSLAAVIPAIGASSQDIYRISDNATAVDIYDSKMEVHGLAQDSNKHSHTKNSHRKHRKPRKLKNSVTTKSLPKETSLAAVIPAIGACSEDICTMSDNVTALDVYDTNMEVHGLAQDSIKHSHTKNSHRKHRKPRNLKNSLTAISLPKPTSLAVVVPTIGASSQDVYRMKDNATAVDIYDSNIEIYELAEDSIKHSHTKNSHRKHQKPRKLKNSLTTKSLPKPTSLAAVIPAIGASSQDIYRISDNATAVDIYDSKMEIHELAEDSNKHPHTKNSHRKHRKPRKLKNSVTTKSLPKQTSLAAVIPAIGACSEDICTMSDATALDVYDTNMDVHGLAQDSIKHSHTKNSHRKYRKPRNLKKSLTAISLPKPISLAVVVPAIGASSQDVYRMSDNATAVDIYDSNMEIYELAEDSIKHSHTKNSHRKHRKPKKLKNSLTTKSLPKPTGLAAVVPAIGASSQDIYRMSDNATVVDKYDS
ncbi:uncharacterized protein LOC124444464 [Xenia sp. Carnegie-2017]|uniref:uncharacterized protein LOC124444464 n=1 Tax=Xenia sp. Carnegie-2017 TaxID=2897299 RepID=UPI001F039CB1|nr:uncharacterized protein LOC124444464 [Xenia sp. Carnegie-2017]